MIDSAKIISYQAHSTRQTPPHSSATGIAYTGASCNYLLPTYPHNKIGTTKSTITVGLTDGNILHSTNDLCLLDIPQLPLQARGAHLLPGISHSSLLSIRKLCDAGCTSRFDNNNVTIDHNNKIIIYGTRDLRTGLWRIPLSAPTLPTLLPVPQQYHSVYHMRNLTDMIKFLHATAFSPVASTWIKAIRQGFFQSWPGLTAALVQKYLLTSIATSKGHLDQTRKNVRSTTTLPPLDPDPPQETNNEQTHCLFATIEKNRKKSYRSNRSLPSHLQPWQPICSRDLRL